MQDAILSDEAPHRDVVGRIRINWHVHDREMKKTGEQRIDDQPAKI